MTRAFRLFKGTLLQVFWRTVFFTNHLSPRHINISFAPFRYFRKRHRWSIRHRCCWQGWYTLNYECFLRIFENKIRNDGLWYNQGPEGRWFIKINSNLKSHDTVLLKGPLERIAALLICILTCREHSLANINLQFWNIAINSNPSVVVKIACILLLLGNTSKIQNDYYFCKIKLLFSNN